MCRSCARLQPSICGDYVGNTSPAVPAAGRHYNLKLRFGGCALYVTLFLQAAPSIEGAYWDSLAPSPPELAVQARFVGASVPFHALPGAAAGADVWMYWRSGGPAGLLPAPPAFPGYIDLEGADEPGIARALALAR